MADISNEKHMDKLLGARIESRGDLHKLAFLIRQASLDIQTQCATLNGHVSNDIRAGLDAIDRLAQFIFETSKAVSVLSKISTASDQLEFSCRRVALPSKKIADSDLALLELEREFMLCDHALDNGGDVDRWGCIVDEIIATETRSLDGIRAKARVACHLQLGDLDDLLIKELPLHDDGTLLESILRDLIRTFDPKVENPGAAQTLLREMTNGDL